MNSCRMTVAGLCVFVLTITGCSRSESGNAPQAQQPAAPTTNEKVVAEQGGLPESLFIGSAPIHADALRDVKSSASTGDRVTFEARIGGRVSPFIDGRAMFFVTDSSLKSCDQLHGDACKTPWDYCCEARDNLLANMATVQVVGADGRPLKISLRDQHGLEPLRTVFITGVVEQMDESGTFTVNAEAIHVVEG